MSTFRFAKRFSGPVLCAVLASLTSPVQANQPATAERNKAQVSAAFERWAAGGGNFFNEILSPAIVWTIEGSGPSAGTYRGIDDLMVRAVRPLTARLSTPIRPTAQRIWADGDHVIINWRGEATARDGKPYTNDYAWIMRMEQGRAVEVTAFLDLHAYDDVLRRIPPTQQ